ncbi:thiamine pyrophosphate-binding protein [Alphaproteobacteria bacterium]|nr:thiamine pyrophosphate-binding protein [Alphaproteobacteria bacterium]MBT5765615.1 thiamine pyrophosphate-binding protein [Kordiimonadaceae bacterium]MDA9815659.1 thiamine pyrophosphate-binding protein [Alphaproteobacteria bacterium]MDC3311726.1 thiamine pyrophosphate-binding protein [Alphaproteobacteria bacterium]
MKKLTGAAILAELFKSIGITHIFMVPAVLRRTMVEIEERTNIKRLHVHSEKSAAYMADGYARASGKPAICMAQVIGALNIAAGLRDAYLAHSPVIALTGGRDPKTKLKKVYQEIDDMPAFEPVTKLNATIDDVSRFPDMLKQAVRVATSGSPGPVHLQFKGNEGQIDLEETEINDDFQPMNIRIPPHRPICDNSILNRAIDSILSAKRPIIVAGGGARHSKCASELLTFADHMNLPIATSLNGKDLICSTHPLSCGVVGTYSRESANLSVKAADLIIFIGSETGSMTTNFWSLPNEKARVIQIDIEPENLGRNYSLEVAVQGDAKAILTEMNFIASTKPSPERKKWLAQITTLKNEWYKKYKSLMDSDANPIRPERLCKEISDNAPDNALIVVDTGHAGMWMGGMFDLKHSEQSYIRSAGHLGWAFPASIGAKCAVPDRPVICFTGDAGFWYHIAEIEVAVRWNINVIVIVNNNSGGNQSKRGFDRAYGGEQTSEGLQMWTFSNVNFAEIAKNIGAVGIRVENPKDIKPAIKNALELKKPVIIDVVTDIDALAPLAVN